MRSEGKDHCKESMASLQIYCGMIHGARFVSLAQAETASVAVLFVVCVCGYAVAMSFLRLEQYRAAPGKSILCIQPRERAEALALMNSPPPPLKSCLSLDVVGLKRV